MKIIVAVGVVLAACALTACVLPAEAVLAGLVRGIVPWF